MKQEKNSFSRRDFVVNSIMAAASLSVAKFGLAASTNHSNNAVNTLNMNNNNSPLAKRKLGSLEVTELGFGCMNIAWAYGNPPSKVKLFKHTCTCMITGNKLSVIKTSTVVQEQFNV